MGLTNVAKNAIATAIATGTLPVTAFNNANAHIGVGDSTTAYANTQTDLVAATNKFRKPMDATYPTDSGAGVLTYRATFALGDANFAWNEWGVFNAAAAGQMLNRRQEALGTKAGTQSWQFTVTLTFTAA